MFTEENLQRAFADLGGACPPGLFDRLAEAYTEPGRYYHTSMHVEACLQQFDQVRVLASAPAEIELAIWFHDAIYEPRAQDNEERSAEWAVSELRSAGCSEASVGAVRSLVLATKSHQPGSKDEALLVDIDLGVLGAPSHDFERYDAEVRLEYQWVPIEQYREARRKVLQGFLARDSIYHTEVFRNRLEAQARRNLSAKLADLGL